MREQRRCGQLGATAGVRCGADVERMWEARDQKKVWEKAENGGGGVRMHVVLVMMRRLL